MIKLVLLNMCSTWVMILRSSMLRVLALEKEIDGKDKRLIKYLIRHRHTSTLEHNVVTFRFCVPLFVRSQHHRHRTWSYNEISRRYTDENLQFYEPKLFRTQHKSNRQASNEEDMINPLMQIYDPACSKPMSILSSKLVENTRWCSTRNQSCC